MQIINFGNEKEKLVLALWACNQTVKQSAKYLEMSVRSVNYYRGKLKCRLGASSANEAIFKIIMMDDVEQLIRLGKHCLLNSTNFSAERAAM